jgi:hypothetical protein
MFSWRQSAIASGIANSSDVATTVRSRVRCMALLRSVVLTAERQPGWPRRAARVPRGDPAGLRSRAAGLPQLDGNAVERQHSDHVSDGDARFARFDSGDGLDMNTQASRR